MFARDEEGGRDWSDRLTRAIESRRLRDYERKAIKHHALTVVVSDHDRLLAQELAPKAHVEVVANSVDLDRLVPLEPPSSGMPMRILFVGSLDYPPNLEAVTELVEKHLPVLRVAFPDLVVRVVGKDPHGSGARFSGVAGVEIVGAVADVATYYRDSHAVYLPIRNGGGTRIKILEAWALGVPVLSTSVGCEGLQAQDGVHLRRFETPAEGVQALQGLESESETLRANGRALVESHYSHAAAIARLKTLVNELLGAQAG